MTVTQTGEDFTPASRSHLCSPLPGSDFFAKFRSTCKTYAVADIHASPGRIIQDAYNEHHQQNTPLPMAAPRPVSMYRLINRARQALRPKKTTTAELGLNQEHDHQAEIHAPPGRIIHDTFNEHRQQNTQLPMVAPQPESIHCLNNRAQQALRLNKPTAAELGSNLEQENQQEAP